MAGGLGKRLRPLTDEMPKPLLSVGNKPLLQNILESFVHQHFSHFFISVNYKADSIKNYFGDGSQWGIDIRYLEEDKRLGTAGALRLIAERPNAPVIVMNGDLLTRVNFRDLLNYHVERGSSATMCVCEYDVEVPFGVVEINGYQIEKIIEKPIHRFFVNAGIYVIDPDLFDMIPIDTYLDMTSFFDKMIDAGKKTAVFPIHEYWLDVGRVADLDRADFEFEKNFT
jgi:NDP-sugar pyrophosphorylase family protein